jgi:hypothetical protein
MKNAPILLAGLACFLTACTCSNTPRDQIEKHLGISSKGKRILDQYVFGFTGGAPDIPLLRNELLKSHDMQNLTIGLLLMPLTDELDIEMLNGNRGFSVIPQVLNNNISRRGTTLVRPEDIGNLTTHTNAEGRITGTFDWVVPGLYRGRSRFVIKDGKMEYLGVLRKDPVGIYDCYTIFSPYGDLIDSPHWIETTYFVIIEPGSQRTIKMQDADRQTELMNLLKSAKLKSVRISTLKNHTIPLVYLGERADRDRVIKLLGKSDDWKTRFAGRAVGTKTGPSIYESIEEQISGRKDDPPKS